MPRPQSKSTIKPNQSYLKDWDEYQDKRPGPTPILLPVAVDINSDGELTRNRMKADDVEYLFEKCKNEIPEFMSKTHINPFDVKGVFDDYIAYFKEGDTKQGPLPTPLDLNMNKHVWVLFHLPRTNWKFSEGQQYSTENDRDDLRRNFEKICTLNDRNYLLLANRCRSNPNGLKFNLHITISQTIDGVEMETPIIIDPGTHNGGGGSGGD